MSLAAGVTAGIPKAGAAPVGTGAAINFVAGSVTAVPLVGTVSGAGSGVVTKAPAAVGIVARASAAVEATKAAVINALRLAVEAAAAISGLRLAVEAAAVINALRPAVEAAAAGAVTIRATNFIS